MDAFRSKLFRSHTGIEWIIHVEGGRKRVSETQEKNPKQVLRLERQHTAEKPKPKINFVTLERLFGIYKILEHTFNSPEKGIDEVEEMEEKRIITSSTSNVRLCTIQSIGVAFFIFLGNDAAALERKNKTKFRWEFVIPPPARCRRTKPANEAPNPIGERTYTDVRMARGKELRSCRNIPRSISLAGRDSNNTYINLASPRPCTGGDRQRSASNALITFLFGQNQKLRPTRQVFPLFVENGEGERMAKKDNRESHMSPVSLVRSELW